ncbi:flagellar hook-length control protein FliK [Paraburkholderia jirisanensis]
MTNIDTAVAALLGSRVDSLLSIGSRSNATTAQTGTSALTVDTPGASSTTVSLLSNQPQASAQTVLSAIALTLDAIMRSGGDATPSMVGQWPIWPVVPALDAGGAQAGTPLSADGADGGNQSAGAAAGGGPSTSTGAATPAQANGAQGAAGVTPAAVTVPVDALAAALRQTVSESGLFYESHLAEWLSGQRPPASLADEPQNRLVAESTQLPLNWAIDDGADEGLASWWRGGTPTQAGGAAQQNEAAAHQGAANAAPLSRFAAAVQEFAGEAFGGGAQGQTARDGLDGNNAGNSQANTAQAQVQNSTQSMAASVHPATVTLVRQQLDLLATGQFRWSGEAWPGARLDWTVEEGVDRWSRGGSPGDDEAATQPWRTRLTLSLPLLGTVDAELTLVGSQLAARVQASAAGAARLASQGEYFKQRLAAVGIALNVLSIREIAGGSPLDGATAAHAAHVYARSAAAANAASDGDARRHGGRSADLFDGDVLL